MERLLNSAVSQRWFRPIPLSHIFYTFLSSLPPHRGTWHGIGRRVFAESGSLGVSGFVLVSVEGTSKANGGVGHGAASGSSSVPTGW